VRRIQGTRQVNAESEEKLCPPGRRSRFEHYTERVPNAPGRRRAISDRTRQSRPPDPTRALHEQHLGVAVDDDCQTEPAFPGG
jgi:hypothetical protein